MITDHVWRQLHKNGGGLRRAAAAAGECGYMNCRRPRDEHERAISPKPSFGRAAS